MTRDINDILAEIIDLGGDEDETLERIAEGEAPENILFELIDQQAEEERQARWFEMEEDGP